MTIAVCDQEAFYPFRSLVEGQLSGQSELLEAERFVRAAVLHDAIMMDLEPWPYDADSDPRFSEEEKEAGARNVIVAIGPTLDGYDFFAERAPVGEADGVELSATLVHTAREFSQDVPGNPHYNAHIEYLQRLVAVVSEGGSAVVAGDFGRTATERAATYPERLFEDLDAKWQDFARRAGEGDVGILVPPFLAILLTRAAKREALPNVLADMRDELADARRKLWQLLDELRAAATIGEAERIKKELSSASKHMLPTSDTATSPTRVLWSLCGNALGGAATALISHGDALIGAATGAIKAAGSALPFDREFGRKLFGRGAFDLARHVRRHLLQVEYEAVSRHLSKGELRKLQR